MFKQLNKKGYKHYYEGTIEELDSMNKDNQHLYSEIMQVIMWLYEKHGIWIYPMLFIDIKKFVVNIDRIEPKFQWQLELYNSPTEAYEAAIKYCLEKII